MLVIRLTRKGKKNQPFFNMVVTDKRRSSKGGRAVEILGYLDPLTKRRSLKKERVLHWIKVGAQPSPTVHNLLVSEKIIEAKKIAKHKTKPRSEAAASTAGESKKVATSAEASAPKAEPTPAPETPKETPAPPASAQGSGAAKEEPKAEEKLVEEPKKEETKS